MERRLVERDGAFILFKRRGVSCVECRLADGSGSYELPDCFVCSIYYRRHNDTWYTLPTSHDNIVFKSHQAAFKWAEEQAMAKHWANVEAERRIEREKRNDRETAKAVDRALRTIGEPYDA